jgi:PP-loop superfamily ATP-utilizing enzyme
VERAGEITAHLRELGFVYVTLDLAGLRSGSLLEVLPGRGHDT